MCLSHVRKANKYTKVNSSFRDLGSKLIVLGIKGALQESKKKKKNRNLMVFDLLTLPQGHQFDSGMNILLVFCSARHPRRFDMPHDHV